MKNDFFGPIFPTDVELFHRILKAVKKFGMFINFQKVYEFYIRTYSALILVLTKQA